MKVNDGSLVAAGLFDGDVHNGDGGEEGDAEDEPSIDVFEVGRAGEGRQGLGVEGDEGQQGGEAHDAAVLEVVEPNEERGVGDEMQEDRRDVRGEEVVGGTSVEVE